MKVEFSVPEELTKYLEFVPEEDLPEVFLSALRDKLFKKKESVVNAAVDLSSLENKITALLQSGAVVREVAVPVASEKKVDAFEEILDKPKLSENVVIETVDYDDDDDDLDDDLMDLMK